MMQSRELEKTVEEFIYERGLSLESYYIEQTPYSEMLCYKNNDGREFDLPIGDPVLADAVMAKLKQLGVKILRIK